jgi:hypothetical protein
MATIDYTIPGQIKSVQIEPPMNAMARAMELRGLQEASNLNAMKMQEYARARQEENALRQLFASGLKPDSDEFRNRLYSDAPGLAPNIEKGLLERGKASAEIAYKQAQERKEQAETLDRELKNFNSFFSPASVTTLDQAEARTRAMYKNPVLKTWATRFMDEETAAKQSRELFQSDKRAWLDSQLGLSGDKIVEVTAAREKQRREEDTRAYGDYLMGREIRGDTGPILSQSEFIAARNRAPTAQASETAVAPAPVVAPAPAPAPAAAAAPTTEASLAGTTVSAEGTLLAPGVAELIASRDPASQELAKLIQKRFEDRIKSQQFTGDFRNVELARQEIARLRKLSQTPEITAQIAGLERMIAGAEKGRGTTLNVGLSTEKKYGEQFAGNVAKADVDLKDAAERAPEAANTANRILELLQSGQVITGSAANIKLQMSKFLRLGGGSESEAITNTEVLLSSLADSTLGAIKSSGLGSGQGFTNSDRDFLERAKAGQITYEAASLKRLAKLAHTAAAATAGKWNKRSKTIPKSALEGTGISTENIEVPPLLKSAPRNRTPATNAKGWKLHTDADGNSAYVSPDGKQFEEVK